MHLDHPLHHLHSNPHLSEANQQVLTTEQSISGCSIGLLLKSKDPQRNSFGTAPSTILYPEYLLLKFTWLEKKKIRPRTRRVAAGFSGNAEVR